MLDRWCARDESDRPAFATCGLSAPRQNGKNAVLEPYELYALVVCGWHVLHTAHRVKTAKKSFQRLVRYFTDKRRPDVEAMVRNVRYTNGEEAIYLENGGSIEFSARSRAGSRGFDDIQVVVFDEAQDLTDDQLNAVMYTISASSTGERTMIYTGTPPDESSPGTVFARIRDSATGGAAKRMCWHEWGIAEMPPRGSTFDGLLDDVYDANPSMGYVLDEEWTESEFANSDLLGFATERLGYWRPSSRSASVISKEDWEGARIEAIGDGYARKTAFGLKFSADGSSYALAGCKLDSKGNAAVELVELGVTENGTKALARELRERCGKACCVVVDGLSAASAFCDNMAEMNAPRGYVVRPQARDVIAASSGLKDALDDGSLAHTGQPALTDSATGCVRRDIGNRGGWGFGATEAHASEPVEAAALALWGARNSRRDPKRRQRIL